MVKKHLVTCSVMFVSLVVFKLFVYATTERRTPVKATRMVSLFTAPAPEKTAMNFADELIPVANKKVSKKIRLSLRRTSYNNIGSTILHRKASKLFPVIEPILRMYGIPDDFKYIALVESGFREGISAKGAAGIWQFMPQTARDYGLKVSKGRDERLNLRKSTIAACKYIKELYAQFNSWTLAAAAYNCGSPRVQHAINRRNKGNYYHMALNRETGMYVYKIIAVKEVIEKPQDYGYHNVYAYYDKPELLAIN